MTPPEMEIWIGFSRNTELFWIKAFCWHFRHCFAVVKTSQGWWLIDPLASHLDISIYSRDPRFDAPAYLQKQGHTMVSATRKMHSTAAPFGLLSCVGILKRYLGIRSLFILTPDHLHNYLTNTKGRPYGKNYQTPKTKHSHI